MIPKNLALLLPDWNSLDSVRAAHSSLELWAIWLFVALVVCDVVAHLIEDKHKGTAKIFERIGLCCFALAVAAELAAYRYGERNDHLSAQVINSLGTRATNALRDSGTALSQAADAQTKAGDAQKLAGKAEIGANKAKAASSDALTLANKTEGEEAVFAEQIADLATANPRKVGCQSSPDRSKYSGEQKARLEEVAKYRGTLFLIQAPVPSNSYDAWRFSDVSLLASEISCLLIDAGWNPKPIDEKNPPARSVLFHPGVQVVFIENWPAPIPRPQGMPNPFHPSPLRNAVSALVNLLKLNLNGVNGRPERSDQYGGNFPIMLPEGAVLILVGPRPDLPIIRPQPSAPETSAGQIKTNTK